MPEDQPSISSILKNFEDATRNGMRTKLNLVSSISTHLENEHTVTTEEAIDIINICIKETNVNAHVINAISKLLQNNEIKRSLPQSIVNASAFYLVQKFKALTQLHSVSNLCALAMQALLLHPPESLGVLVRDKSEDMLDLIKIGTKKRYYVELQNLINILDDIPPEDAAKFLIMGIPLWMSNVIPKIFTSLTASDSEDTEALESLLFLESLVDKLIKVDYLDNPHWKSCLENICNPKMYPLQIKSMLVTHSNIWHRLWIIVIKLLNNHITKSVQTYGTPINSLLPVVESAFKMENVQRCRAFICWNELIDNFSKETNENCIAKRVRLLIIPLKLNNAKSEDIASVKLDTWWRLIIKFEHKLDKFLSEILIPILHFAFGRNNGKAYYSAALLSDSMKLKCLKVFAEIVGHHDCDCPRNIPKLKSRIFTTKLLVDFWNDWFYSMTTVVKAAAAIFFDNVITQKYLTCIWKSLLVIVSELPDNTIRRDLFTEMLSLCEYKDALSSLEYLPDVKFALITTLLDPKLEMLLRTKGDNYRPICKLLVSVTHPDMTSCYKRLHAQVLNTKLKPLADSIVMELNKSCSNEWFFDNFPSNETSLKLWPRIMESLSELDVSMSPETLSGLFKWPLKLATPFKLADVKQSAMTWYTMYNLMHPRLSDAVDAVAASLCVDRTCSKSLRYIAMCATIGVLKQKIVTGEEVPINLLKSLQDLTLDMKEYNEFDEVVPLLVDTIVIILNNEVASTNEELTNIATSCIKNILNMISIGMNTNINNKETSDNLLMLLGNLLQAVKPLLKIQKYSSVTLNVVEELISQATKISKELSFFDSLMSTLKAFLEVSTSDVVKHKIKTFIDSTEKSESVKVCKVINIGLEFTSPDVRKIKKGKKNEVKIVNQVEENGEEYVVVKSNWKFNPRKLTENQKEKLLRKREDIPALYQDLSQSQDEFKLTTWKTDSQDTTVSTSSKSSKSVTNDDAAAMLKNIPYSDVVPHIIENILHENDKEIPKTSSKEALTGNKSPQVDKISKTNTKSPRLALKDRVFRNMKNLLEKSTPQKEKLEIIESKQIENCPTTPPIKAMIDVNVVQSAPTMISADRPSRVKRKPKKFDDSELFALKKRRYSHNDLQSPSDNESPPDASAQAPADATTNIVETNAEVHKQPDLEQPKSNTSEIKPTEIVKEIITDDTSKTSETKELETKLNDIPSETIEENKETVVEPNDKMDAIEDFPSSVIENKIEMSNDKDNEIVSIDNSDTIAENIEIIPVAPTTPLTKSPVAPTTPQLKTTEERQTKSTVKKRVKTSRIEKELAIDMVEGHPFLKMQSEKRVTRKKIADAETTGRRKSLQEKLNKSKVDATTPKATKKPKEKRSSPTSLLRSISVHETPELIDSSSSSPTTSTSIEQECSEDFIESSQDSTLTTISIKSTKRTPKRQPIINLERIKLTNAIKNAQPSNDDNKSQDLLDESQPIEMPDIPDKSKTHDSKDDIELPQNKTADIQKSFSDLTAEMDTEIVDNDDVIVINDEEIPVAISSEMETDVVGTETQEIAEADTQPNAMDVDSIPSSQPQLEISVNVNEVIEENVQDADEIPVAIADTQHNSQIDVIHKDEASDASSPFKDDVQRKKDFLNNTLEISPIKIQSPDRNKKSPSPETSSDYVVIKLSSPVQSNGEPFEKNGSPEFFTEDKISPEKREVSPPRAETGVSTSSPSSSLSLKKNRPQVRAGGRAAQMLGLCVPDELNTIKNAERLEPEESKKSNTSTPARRNLRVLYNAVGDTSETADSEDSESFLKLKRTLPAVDCSPAGPILKRKLVDIADETTASPASKRKRVSFHDPPVSTTIAVHKYIEPCGVRSPQSSAHKRLERQSRQPYTKTPKRLDNAFKLDSVLSKAVESFAEDEPTPITSDDTQSLETTPAVEIVRNSQWNDVEPICPALVDCRDPIDVIASELSSPSMKHLLAKALNLTTVGDLAKMTELQVNRLSIKSPKVETAKCVLDGYACRLKKEDEVIVLNDDVQLKSCSVEMQTDRVSSGDMEVQTDEKPLSEGATQTDMTCTMAVASQTDEPVKKTTPEVITTCLKERADFVEKLSENLPESSIRQIAEKLSTYTLTDMTMDRSDISNSLLLNRILDRESRSAASSQKENHQLTFVRDYLCDRFDSNSLILFCSQLLQKIHEKKT